jgi:peptidoglycan/xylan/chitin deacetylase (PgdA/CDA1 family)
LPLPTKVTPTNTNADSLDWKDLPAPEITKRVISGVNPGSIVLFHNAAKHTPEALPSILEQLIANGYKIVPVSEILLDGETYLDHTGKQFRKNMLAP